MPVPLKDAQIEAARLSDEISSAISGIKIPSEPATLGALNEGDGGNRIVQGSKEFNTPGSLKELIEGYNRVQDLLDDVGDQLVRGTGFNPSLKALYQNLTDTRNMAKMTLNQFIQDHFFLEIGKINTRAECDKVIDAFEDFFKKNNLEKSQFKKTEQIIAGKLKQKMNELTRREMTEDLLSHSYTDKSAFLLKHKARPADFEEPPEQYNKSKTTSHHSQPIKFEKTPIKKETKPSLLTAAFQAKRKSTPPLPSPSESVIGIEKDEGQKNDASHSSQVDSPSKKYGD